MSEIKKKPSDFGFEAFYDSRPPGQYYPVCPFCSASRKKSSARCMSLKIDHDGFTFNCHHCNETGGYTAGNGRGEDFRTSSYVPIDFTPNALSEAVLAWFRSRGIGADTVRAFDISESGPTTARWIQFPYKVGGHVTAIKSRNREKNFQWSKGAKPSFFNCDMVAGSEEVIICEGELDVMALFEAGYHNAISVPFGAPGANDKSADGKLKCLDEQAELFDDVEMIVLAVDSDAPGVRLRDELARRLGKSRCRIVDWPEGCKDANDVLRQHGAEALVKCMESARPYPVEGIFRAREFNDDVRSVWEVGDVIGPPTGWRRFDELIRFSGGLVTVWTGIPGHGKSTFIMNVMNKLTAAHDQRVAWYSPEHTVSTQVRRIAESMTGKPMSPLYGNQMSAEEREFALEIIDRQHHFIMPQSAMYDHANVLERATVLVKHYGINHLIIDAYNQIEHQIEKSENETNYVARFLNTLRFWAREYGTHIHLVAHPTKMRKYIDDKKESRDKDMKYEVPTLYSISGSAHFFNIPDNGICVYRNMDLSDPTSQENRTVIYVQKLKNEWDGELGFATFDYMKGKRQYHPRDK